MIDDTTKRGSRTKADLVELVYRSHGGLTKHEAAEIVDSIFRTVKTSLLDGNAVNAPNLFTRKNPSRVHGRYSPMDETNADAANVPRRAGSQVLPSAPCAFGGPIGESPAL